MYLETADQELKRELNDTIKKEIVAFLNTMNGKILVGVNDDGSIYEPFLNQDRDEIDTKVANWLQDSVYPLTYGLVRHYFNEDGVLVIEIKEGKDKPYYIKEKGPKPEGVYKRVGRSIRKASEDEILKMIMTSRHYIYEEDVSEEQNLTFDSLRQEFRNISIDLTDRNMVSLRLRNASGQYTNLAYLLSDQSDIVVKIAEYDKDRNFRLKKQLKGSLIDLFKGMKEQADRLNDVSAWIDIKTFRRNETVSYPGASLREVILNAIIHSDYFIRSNIKIEFFEDRCRITNPGGIYNATLEEIMKGTQTYRNPGLVSIFDKLGLIENFGTGIPRTMDAYKDTDRKPVFEATDNFFYVTLPNLNYHEADQLKAPVNNQIKDRDLSILKVIHDNPGIKVSEIHAMLQPQIEDLTENTIRNSLKRKLADITEYRGSRKTGGYYLKDN